jgi:hypothetical protein
MLDVLSRLAGSKLVAYLGAAIVLLGTLCLAKHDSIAVLAPGWGLKFCAFIDLAGAVLAMLGRGVADRRNMADAPTAGAKAMPGAVAQPSRRRKP